MGVGRPLKELRLSEAERDELMRWTRRASTAQALALRARIVALERAAPAPGPAAAADPYRRVHLTADAPAWLVAEVRRAFRRRHHPDTAADQQNRRRSEEVFKRAEADFAAIARLRGT